jgi:hypothetical protein
LAILLASIEGSDALGTILSGIAVPGVFIDNDGHFDTRVMIFAPDLRTSVINPETENDAWGACYGYDVHEIDYRSNAG